MGNMIQNYKELWDRCKVIIRDNVNVEAYQQWFEPIEPVSIENDTLLLKLPSHLYFEWIEEHYINLLRKVIKKEIGPYGKLRYTIVMEKGSETDKPKTVTLPSQNRPTMLNNNVKRPIDVYNVSNKEIPDPFVLPGLKKYKIHSNLIPYLNFENYIEGNCNSLARSAGWAIAKAPGYTAFNPFFIYSDVGLGKTHLANAIGLQIKENFPDKLVLYVNTDLFYQQFLEAVKNHNINDFIYFYQNVDVLILDDIQYIAIGEKVKTQEVFFNIFNYLHQKGKQIIITSDKSPVEISGFETRILSRFKWGLTTDLQVPDYETRTSILKKKLENNGIEFPQNVIEYIALRVTSNTRELEGAMIAILAQASLNKKDITVELAKEMVDKYVKSAAKEISIEYIVKVVCDFFQVPVSSINEQTRRREISLVRQVCMYFAKKHTNLSLEIIGINCGNKHHATVLHACKTINNLCDTDKKMRQYINEIEKKMTL